jgi:hypothetical protein
VSAGTTRADLGRELAAELTAVPGVRRLEPSLRSTLRGMSRGGAAVDAVPVKVRAQVADVSVDIATDASRPAVDVAAEVQERIRSVLLARGVVPGQIDVSVLTVEA